MILALALAVGPNHPEWVQHWAIEYIAQFDDERSNEAVFEAALGAECRAKFS